MGRQNRLLILVVVIALAIAAIPAVVSAAGGTFIDDDTSIFEANIEWMAASGVTKGCSPDEFCPEDNVTRGQMAAFMQRFAGYLGAEDGVVSKADNATTAGTAGSAATAGHATTAATATNAGHATTADSATTAASASNATTIAGRTVGCTAGQTEFAGECWENAPRASVSSVFEAADACGDEGGRLPGGLELRRFGQISSITTPAGEWTSEIYFDGSFRAYTWDQTFGLADHSTIFTAPLRCVFPLIETSATPASVAPAGTVGANGV